MKQTKKKNLKPLTVLASLLLTLVLLTGCAPETAEQGSNQAESQEISASLSAIEVEYDSEDLDDSFDPSTATNIQLLGDSITIDGEGASASGSILTISKAGTYVLEGTLTDGQILVEAGEEDLVRLVLNGVEISCSDNAAIWSKQADKTVLIIAAGTTNAIEDGSTYALVDEEDAANAAIFSQNDLSINGTGSLTVTGNFNNGIGTKDDLIITGGTLQMTAINDGLKGRDSIAINGGTFSIDAGEDAIQSDNDEDVDKGWISLDGGTFTIVAADDGIHATTILQLNGADIQIEQSYEGLEGSSIVINSGNIQVTAQDDGINAAGITDSDCSITINGGTVSVDAAGDGIDSNGSLYFAGGTVLVNGPTNNGNGALDYNGTCEVSGGILTIAGSSGMAQAPGPSSTQNSLIVYYAAVQQAGTQVSLVDDAGEVILEITPTKEYQSVLFSSSELEQGMTYTLKSGADVITEVTLSGATTSINDDGSVGMKDHPRPEGENGQMPPEQ